MPATLGALALACAGDPGVADAGPRGDAHAAGDAAAWADASVGGDRGAELGPDGGFRWPVPTGTVAITPAPDWSARVGPEHPFVHPPDTDGQGAPSSPRWVDFVVMLRDPSRVLFADSRAFASHEDFVAARVDPFLGRSSAELERLALREDGQELAFGTLLFPPRAGRDELGIALLREEPYHPEMARALLALVRRSVDTASTTAALYFPSSEQRRSALRDGSFFAASGFPVGEASRWDGPRCSAAGWAIGRLSAAPDDELGAALAAGRLGLDDVVLGVRAPPSLLPFAGFLGVSSAPASARAPRQAVGYGIPFGSLPAPPRELLGRLVLARVEPRYGTCVVRVSDAEGRLEPADRADLAARSAPRPLEPAPRASAGTFVEDVDALADPSPSHGLIVARYRTLRAMAPADSSQAWALSFDAHAAFLGQPSGAGTLGESIERRLAEAQGLPAVLSALAEVRGELAATALPPEVARALREALAAVPAGVEVELMSSENVAGEPRALRACPADDTDGDARGPSACDPRAPDERGVLEALPRLYAGAYEDAAFLERRRRGVDERALAIGALLLEATRAPRARGIARVEWGEFSQHIALSSQRGEVGVGDREEWPETASVDAFGSSYYPSIVSRSSRVRWGQTVMGFPADYERLASRLRAAGEAFAARSGRGRFALEIAFDERADGAFSLRSLEELAWPPPERREPTFLLGGALRRCTFQGESGDVWGNHRLKSRWTLTAASTPLEAARLGQSFYREVSIERRVEGAPVVRSGLLGAFPMATHGFDAQQITDGFSEPEARFELATTLEREVSGGRVPVLTLDDAHLGYSAAWRAPVFALDWQGVPSPRTEDFTTLAECPEDVRIDAGYPLVVREVRSARRLVRASYHWPPAPTGATAGYTAPLAAWRETVIEGFTAQPLVLRGYWSQTYRPGHHNFTEELLFEPRLDEGVPLAQKEELERADVRLIHVETGFEGGTIRVITPAGEVRLEE